MGKVSRQHRTIHIKRRLNIRSWLLIIASHCVIKLLLVYAFNYLLVTSLPPPFLGLLIVLFIIPFLSVLPLLISYFSYCIPNFFSSFASFQTILPSFSFSFSDSFSVEFSRHHNYHFLLYVSSPFSLSSSFSLYQCFSNFRLLWTTTWAVGAHFRCSALVTLPHRREERGIAPVYANRRKMIVKVASVNFPY